MPKASLSITFPKREWLLAPLSLFLVNFDPFRRFYGYAKILEMAVSVAASRDTRRTVGKEISTSKIIANSQVPTSLTFQYYYV